MLKNILQFSSGQVCCCVLICMSKKSSRKTSLKSGVCQNMYIMSSEITSAYLFSYWSNLQNEEKYFSLNFLFSPLEQVDWKIHLSRWKIEVGKYSLHVFNNVLLKLSNSETFSMPWGSDLQISISFDFLTLDARHTILL